jgi:hypothetical protein
MQNAPKRHPFRRVVVISILAALAGASAWNASTTPWFTGAFPGEGDASWINLTLDSIAHNSMLESPTGGVPGTYTILGMPGPRAWLLVAGVLAALAALLRLGLFAVISLGALWASRSAALAVEHALTGDAADGRFVHHGTDFVTFLDWIWVTGALVLVLALQVTYANGVERRRRGQAGETTDPGVLDIVEKVGQSITGRYATAPAAKPRQVEKTSA